MSTLIKKLHIERYNRKLMLNMPVDIKDFNGISFETVLDKGKYDLIILFIFSLDEFVQFLQNVIDKDLLLPEGILYFVYPKKGNKQYKMHIGRDEFLNTIETDDDGYIKGSFLKFNKMVAFNEVFTVIGLKHQTHRKDKSSIPSQRAADYIHLIPELRKSLNSNAEVLGCFDTLKPGYQRDWARYVYSARTQETIRKRQNEMVSILKQGYHSIDLFRKAQKEIQ